MRLPNYRASDSVGPTTDGRTSRDIDRSPPGCQGNPRTGRLICQQHREPSGNFPVAGTTVTRGRTHDDDIARECSELPREGVGKVLRFAAELAGGGRCSDRVA